MSLNNNVTIITGAGIIPSLADGVVEIGETPPVRDPIGVAKQVASLFHRDPGNAGVAGQGGKLQFEQGVRTGERWWSLVRRIGLEDSVS